MLSIFKNICDTLDVLILEHDIRSYRRVAKMNPASDRPRNIIVTLTTPRMRDVVLSAFHRYNKSHPDEKLNSKHVGVTADGCQIYVCEHLSADLKKLHAEARDFKK